MVERISARALLRAAGALYDAPCAELAPAASSAWKGLFISGGEWMRFALGKVRGTVPAGPSRDFNYLGVVKYGLASAGALVVVLPAVFLETPWLLLVAVPLFYAIEAQMVFLFPLVLDGSRRPFFDSHVWTGRAGGTLAVMRVVLPLAATMLGGGFLGKGFVRSWCLGCLAVCLWYEALRTQQAMDQLTVGCVTLPPPAGVAD